MKIKIPILIFLGVIALFGWVPLSLHLDAKKGMRMAQQILSSGGSLEELEKAIGAPTHEYSASEEPSWVSNIDGFETREGAIVWQYNREGLPYWWVIVQFTKKDSEILWFRVAKHGR